MLPARASLGVRAGLVGVARIRGWARELFRRWGLPARVAEDLLVALSEVSTNVVRHGYAGRSGTIRVEAARTGDAVRLEIEDDAEPFAPGDAKTPAPERLSEGGYGLSLIHALADEIRHETLGDRGNRTTLVKRLGPRRRDRGKRRR